MKRIRNRQPVKESGMTLIELLVVATIIMMVTAISVPVLKPMLKSQATNNAATTVVTYLNKAKSRAMLTGRPCGVFFEIWSGTEYYQQEPINGVNRTTTYGACMILRQVEVPPPYTGMTDDATVSVVQDASTLSGLNINASQDQYWTHFVNDTEVKLGAKVQFGDKGTWFPCDVNDTGFSPIPQTNSSFKVLLGPRPTLTAPVGLPQGTVVDLQFSGVDDAKWQILNEQAYSFLDNSSDGTVQTGDKFASCGMVIMFLPNGEVDSIRGMFWDDVNANSYTPKRHRCQSKNYLPGGNIYLLIGRWDRIAALGMAEDNIANINDANNFWVVINPRSGLITTAPVNPIVTNLSDLQGALNQSREFALVTKKNAGGK